MLMDIDNGTSCYNVGANTSIPINAWEWINYNDGSTANVIKATLSQGSHTFKLTGTAAGVSVDRIVALSDASCVPTGTGDNCAPSNVLGPSVSLTAPAASATVSGTATVSATASSAAGVTQVGVTQVVFKVDGSTIATDTASP